MEKVSIFEFGVKPDGVQAPCAAIEERTGEAVARGQNGRSADDSAHISMHHVDTGRTPPADNTAVINAAIHKCAAEGIALVFPAGTYRTSSIKIPSNAHIILEKGAELSFIDDFNAYPPVFSRWEGVNCWSMQPLVFIAEAENVIFEGEGTLNGNGRAWWDYSIERRLVKSVPEIPIEKKLGALNPGYENQPGGGGGRQCQFLRPDMLQIFKSNNVTIRGISIINSPFWTVHPVYSSNLTLENISICNPADSPNTDGIDIDSCHHVRVTGCSVDVGDDGICLKSGSGEDGIKTNIPTHDVHVENCVIKNAHGGIVVGSETAAGINNFTAVNCRLDGTDRGLRIKTRRGRGGHIHTIKFSNIHMKNTICPLSINMYYKWGSDNPELYSLEVQPVTESTPEIDNVIIENCTGTESRGAAAFLAGLPEKPLKNITVKNCRFDVLPSTGKVYEIEMCRGLPDIAERGIRLRNIQGVIENVSTNEQPPFIQEDGAVISFR